MRHLEKYNRQADRQQKRMLKKLKAQETLFTRKLNERDSLLCKGYLEGSLSFDSISKTAAKTEGKLEDFSYGNKTVDSLKRIADFCKKQNPETGQDKRLSDLAARLNCREYINRLINQKIQDVRELSDDVTGLQGHLEMEKTLYYGKAKIAVLKSLSNDPSKAEEMALEYLRGVDGFDKAAAGSVIQPSGTEQDLIAQGFQTTALLQGSLQQKYGSNAGEVFSRLGGDITRFQGNSNAMRSIKDLKQASDNLRVTSRPTFKINPMKALPFKQRLEKQFNWQLTRPKPDGSTPALITASGGLSYKHTRHMSGGIGVMSALGLGYGWRNVSFSFQGVGGRVFYTWEISSGFSACVEYSRMYKAQAFTTVTSNHEGKYASPHNTPAYEESMLIGVAKKYNINKKISGSVQVLYDIWWWQKGLNSPLQIRFVTIK